MKKHISYLLSILLFCSLFMAACADGSETEQVQPEETASLEPQDEGIDEDAEPQQEIDESEFTRSIVDLCERNGVGLTFFEMDAAFGVYSQVETQGLRTVCDTFNGERNASFQILVDEYEDESIEQEEFRLMKQSLLDSANSTEIIKVLMDDENTFATHMDAYGSVSNLMYMKDYGPYMVTLVAIKKENYDAAYAIMEEIDAYINEL